MPAVGMADRAGKVCTQPCANRSAECKNGHSHRAAGGRKIVGHDRVARRGSASLTDPYANPGKQQLPEGLGKPAQRGRHRPHGDRKGEQVPAVLPIRQPGQGNTHRHIKQSKRHAADQADTKIGQPQVCLDLVLDLREHVPVCDADRIDQHHDEQHVPALRKAWAAVR